MNKTKHDNVIEMGLKSGGGRGLPDFDWMLWESFSVELTCQET